MENSISYNYGLKKKDTRSHSLENILDKTTLQSAFKLAEKNIKVGDLVGARSVYIDITRRYPGNKKATKMLKSLTQNIKKTMIDPPSEIYQPIIDFYSVGRFEEVISRSSLLLTLYPNSIVLLAISAAGHLNKGNIHTAINYYTQVILIEPRYLEAHYQLGSAYFQIGDFGSAIISYKNALNIDENNIEATFNLGLSYKMSEEFDIAIEIFQKLSLIKPKDYKIVYNLAEIYETIGDFQVAIGYYDDVVDLKPDHLIALLRLGELHTKLHNFSAAFKCYDKLLQFDPNNLGAKTNVALLFKKMLPTEEFSSPIFSVNRLLQEAFWDMNKTVSITNKNILNLLHKCCKIVNHNNVTVPTRSTQAFVRSSLHLNCDRHMGLFNEQKIISQFCFDCYKVQIEPSNLIDLIKLHLIFNSIVLENDNIRKCMVELRKYLTGYYKGIIYCRSLADATSVSKKLNDVIFTRTGMTMPMKIKRGCSEYEIKFPDYGKIEKSGQKTMNYEPSWKSIEKHYDSKHSQTTRPSLYPDLMGLNLHDFFVIQKWINYAYGIGDTSIKSIPDLLVKDEKIQIVAKSRLNTSVLV